MTVTAFSKGVDKFHVIPAMGITCLITLLLLPLRSLLDPVNLALFYLLPVLLSATYWGMWSAIGASVTGVLAFDIFYIPPVHRISVSDTRYLLTFATYMTVAIATSRLASHLREQMVIAQKKRHETEVLQSISRDMTAVVKLDHILAIITGYIRDLYDSPCLILLPDSNGELWPRARMPESVVLGDSEARTAVRVYESGKKAGLSVEGESGSKILYLPFHIKDETIGILCMFDRTSGTFAQAESLRLLESLVDLGAVAIEKARLAEESAETRWVKESERLYSSIFNSVSHELKTPLSTIMAAAANLLDDGIMLDPPLQREMLETIQNQSARMDRLLGNLLNMARLEAGRMKLSKNLADINDLIHTAILRFEDNMKFHKLRLQLSRDLPFVEVDEALIEQVIVNLLDNAVKYSPRGTVIEMSTKADVANVYVSVTDMGSGVPPGELELVFEKFYRAQDNKANRGGTGLGLSICKGIVEAHGGRIWAANGENAGLTVSFSMAVENGEDEKHG